MRVRGSFLVFLPTKAKDRPKAAEMRGEQEAKGYDSKSDASINAARKPIELSVSPFDPL